MTYEKLSRAMRSVLCSEHAVDNRRPTFSTYYEKQILLPVPKTGLYPKKLVYRFGPSAHGWAAPDYLAHACRKLQQTD